MRQRGVAEWTGEGGGDGDEEERHEDALVGEDGWGAAGLGRGVITQVDVSYEGGEEGLESIEEDGEFEEFGGGRGAVWRCGETLLEESPCKAVYKMLARSIEYNYAVGRSATNKEPYIPPTANTNCNAPASFTSGRGSGFTKSPFRIACPLLLSFSLSKFLGLRLGVPPPSFLLKYSDDGSLRNGVACFVRAITCAGLTRCALESSERKESQVRPLN